MNIFPKKTSRWPIDTWKDAHHHSSSGKCKSKLRDITSHLSEWLKSTQETRGVGKDVEIEECLCTIGGNASWCSHCGKQFLKKLKRTTLWSSNHTTGDRAKDYKDTNTKGYMHPYIYSSIIYNSQDMEAAQVSFERWMDKEVENI